MAERVVVDASAALAFTFREPEAYRIERALNGHRGELLVPGHFWLEIVNTAARRSAWSPDAVVEAFRDLDELGVVTVELDRPTLLVAVDLMARHGLTAYDAAYLAVAEVTDADLLTLDGALAAAAGDRSVFGDLPHGRRLHEERAPYGTTAPPNWANHGRYLAELRWAALDATRAAKG